MRVLLFCQTGDGRPKCVGRVREWLFPALLHYRDRRDPVAYLKKLLALGVAVVAGDTHYKFTPHQFGAKTGSDRWWLVECENAEAGRRVIASYEDTSAKGPVAVARWPWGRILASGGKA